MLVSTDANTRVYPRYLRDVAAGLERPSVGLVTHMVAGVGERRAGAAFDNQAWNTFVAPNVAMAATLGMDQVVGKSVALRREVLDRLGGWESVKDVLGEDQQLGSRLAALGLQLPCLRNARAAGSGGDDGRRLLDPADPLGDDPLPPAAGLRP